MTPLDRPVSDFMTSPVMTIHPDASLAAAERRLEGGTYSSLAVTTGDGQLCGVLSRTDLLRIGRLRASMAQDAQLLTMPQQLIRTRMTREVVTAKPTDSLQQAASAMVQRHIHRVFVVEGGRPIGVLSSRDLMRAVVEARLGAPLSRWMSSPVLTVNVIESVAAATDLLHNSHVRGVVVLEGEWPVGVFTQTEALAASTLDAGTRLEEVMSCALLCLPSDLPLFRAAAFALKTRARRILVVAARELKGTVAGLDIARAVAADATSS